MKNLKHIKTVFRMIKVFVHISPIYAILSIISISIVASTPILNAYIMSKMLNILTGFNVLNARYEIVKLLIFYGIVVFAEAAGNEIYASVRWILFRYKISEYFTEKVNRKMKEIDLEFFENPEFTNLKKNALDGYEWRPAEMLQTLLGVIQSMIRTIVSFIALVSITKLSIVVIILSMIPSFIVEMRLRAGLYDLWSGDTDLRKKYGHLMYINTAQSFFKDMKLLGINDYFVNKLIELVKNTNNKQRSIQYKRIFGVIITALIPIVVSGIFIYSIVDKVILGVLGVGILTFYITSLFEFRGSLGNVLFEFNYTLDQTRYLENILQFLDMKSKIKNKSNGIKFIDSPPDIDFKNVSFVYPNTKIKVLENFNLHIPPKQKIAIVGENGAGKTTIIKLILRLYDVTSGDILVNGKSIKDYDSNKYRDIFGVLLQDFTTFHLPTIEENIGFGNLQKYNSLLALRDSNTPKSIINASQKAVADKFIGKYKKKYREILGKEFGGVEFSGGEYQRLALARTFFRDSGFIIMDEPTSSVDAKAEYEIFASLKDYLKDKSVLFVSHRFSTVRIADRIVVIENGRIVEDGSHTTLLNNNGLYKKMFELQAEGYK